MEKAFCMGLALGMLGGALIVANNNKARSLVKKSQDEVLEKAESIMDEKLKGLSGKGDYDGDVAED